MGDCRSTRRAGALACAMATVGLHHRNARALRTLFFGVLLLLSASQAAASEKSAGRELLIFNKHYCSADCYGKGGYCSAQADCGWGWERGNCGNPWLTWCGCCVPNYSSSSQEGTDSSDLNFNRRTVEPEETEEAPPPPSLTLSQNSEEEEEVEASGPGEPQQAPALNSTGDSSTQEIVPIVQRQEGLEEEQEEDIFPPPLPNTTTSSNGTAGNETVVNGTTATPEEEANTVVLTLPPQESTNQDITLQPGEREGEFIAIIG